MLYERKRCWLKHKYKEDFDFCPLCHAPIRWVYVDEVWVPCDREPITYQRDLDGKLMVVEKGELKKYCKEYRPGDKGQFKLGLLPHVFSCDGLPGYNGVKIERL